MECLSTDVCIYRTCTFGVCAECQDSVIDIVQHCELIIILGV